jgi:hypothetical protein
MPHFAGNDLSGALRADDVLLAVKERARRENRTAGAVLSDLARQALTGQYAPAEADRAPWSLFTGSNHSPIGARRSRTR